MIQPGEFRLREFRVTVYAPTTMSDEEGESLSGRLDAMDEDLEWAAQNYLAGMESAANGLRLEVTI